MMGIFFSLPPRLDRLWGPPRLLSSEYRRHLPTRVIKQPVSGADHSPKFSAEVKKAWSYEGVSKCFRTDLITKHRLTTININLEATQRVMAAKPIRLAHKIAIQLHLVAESCTICSSRSRRPVRKLLDTLSCTSTPQTRLHGVMLS
jgi:hypothetical protein